MVQLNGKQAGTLAIILLMTVLLVFASHSRGRQLLFSAGRPFISAWHGICTWSRETFSSSKGKEDRLVELEMELSQARVEAAAAKELAMQNDQLRTTLGLKPFARWRSIRAEVLTRDPVLWDCRFTISKGGAEGITVGAIVMAEQAVIGRVAEVNRHSAIVDTVYSPECRLSVVVANTGLSGLLRGTGTRGEDNASGCVVDFFPLAAYADKGWPILTSGLGGELPPGLLVAKIVPAADGAVVQTIDHARKRVLAQPVANLDALRFVTIYASKN